MNKVIFLIIIFSYGLNITNCNAAPVGSQFNYQGELVDNGTPANGDYDITVDIFDNLTGGGIIDRITFNNTAVVNGLFNLEGVDFGDSLFSNNDDFYLEISVQPSSGGVFETLSPRQRLNAVPYAIQAEFLAPGLASNGDVLQFDGSDWVPSALGSSSPWNQSGATLTSPGKVGIGEPAPSAQLHITNNTSEISLLKIDDVSDTRMIVLATGKIGVGLTNPAALFQINSEAGEDPFRVQINSSTKLRVFSNGGVTLGANFAGVPDNGIYVGGDAKQDKNGNGMLKFMLRANCDSTPSIVRHYNGTNIAGTPSIIRNSIGNCTITLPFDISDNYISVSPIHVISGSNRVVNCENILSDIVCQMSIGSTAAAIGGNFDVLVY